MCARVYYQSMTPRTVAHVSADTDDNKSISSPRRRFRRTHDLRIFNYAPSTTHEF